jgi:DNA transformation protein and related proteins
MAKSDVEAIVARLQPLGPVRARAMFGGHGLFLDDRMFALFAWGAVYFKADAVSEPAFAAAGGAPFVYDRKGTPARMSYWSVAVDPAADLGRWLAFAELGLAAAKRAKRPLRVNAASR